MKFVRVIPVWERMFHSNGIYYPWGMSGMRIPRQQEVVDKERECAWESATRNQAIREGCVKLAPSQGIT